MGIGIVLFGAIIIGLAAFVGYAHRDPNRKTLNYDGYLSPADGIVVGIYSVKGKKQFIPKKQHGIYAMLSDFPKGKILVVIMMKFWHNHTQRIPNDGKIEKIEHKEGQYLNAVFGEHEQATIENENVSFTISGKKPCKIYLVAGLVARRIKSVVKKGDELKQGERIGKIHFGSQVAIVLPETELLIKKGDKVYAGLTKLAR